MRRTGVIVASALAFVSACSALSAGSPARAHFCSTPLQVPVGRPVTFTVGVPAEDSPVSRVEIEIPDGFELHRPVEREPWRATVEGDTVTYTGGPINLFQCAFFTLAGEVPDRVTLVVPFVTYGADGEKIREFRSPDLNHLDAAQVVYAGTQPDRFPEEAGEGRPAWLALAGWALIGVAVGGGAVMWLRRKPGASAGQ